jgi:hypothetical protein
LFASPPDINENGTLKVTPAANMNGSATVTVRAKDNGNGLNGNVNTSAPQTFVITQ